MHGLQQRVWSAAGRDDNLILTRTPSRVLFVFAALVMTYTLGAASVFSAGDCVEPPFTFEQCVDCDLAPFAQPFGMGMGVAAADFDNDGDVDLFLPAWSGAPDQLLVNQGDGTFIEQASAAGLAEMEQSRCALWFDSDGDADLDLLIANDDAARPYTYTYMRQEKGGIFVDATAGSGFDVPLPEGVEPTIRHRGGMAAGDLDNDGDLDLITCMWNGYPTLFRNNADGTFTDITIGSGVENTIHFSHQAVLLDVNHDGWLDIYIAVDFLWNCMYINQGDGTFVDIAPKVGADNAMNDMGLSIGDFDNDRDFDIFVTNIFDVGVHSILLRQEFGGHTPQSFSEVSEQLGVDDGGWGWGVTFFDADNDGWLDLAATNGWSNGSMWDDDESRFYWNRLATDAGGFDEIADPVGIDDRFWGSCLINADLNRDGHVDLVQTFMDRQTKVLLNTVEPGSEDCVGHWVTVKPRQTSGMNRFAIGSVVSIRTGATWQQRLIHAGTSYLGQEPAEAHFGIGSATEIDELIVQWPDGDVTCMNNVTGIDDVLLIEHEPGPPPIADLTGDGRVDVADLLLMLHAWGPCPDACASPCVADITGDEGDPDCTVDINDLLLLLSSWSC